MTSPRRYRLINNDNHRRLTALDQAEIDMKVVEGSRLDIRPPARLYGKEIFLEDAQNRFGENGFHVPDIHSYTLRNVQVTGGYAIILGDQVVDSTFVDHRGLPGHAGSSSLKLDRARGDYVETRPGKPENRIEEPVFLFASGGDSMHHHWLFDTCTKLWVWEKLLGKSMKLAVPKTVKGYQRDAYKALGLDDSQIIYFNPGAMTTFRELHFCPRLAQADYMVKPAFLYFRNRMFDAYGIDPTAPPTRKVFLNRRDVPNDARLMLNEPEVEAYLLKEGFESFSGGDLSFENQVRLFAEASHAVIVHGSGGANCLFLNDGAKTTHLHPSAIANFRQHSRINGMLDQDYDYVFGPSFFRPARLHANPWYAPKVYLSQSVGAATSLKNLKPGRLDDVRF